MRIEELNEEFLVALAAAHDDRLLQSDGSPKAAISIWGYTIPAIIAVVLEKAHDLGRVYRPQIEAAGKQAIDRVVALDLPWVPEDIEGVIDAATKQLGYAAVVAMLDALFAEQAPAQP